MIFESRAILDANIGIYEGVLGTWNIRCCQEECTFFALKNGQALKSIVPIESFSVQLLV